MYYFSLLIKYWTYIDTVLSIFLAMLIFLLFFGGLLILKLLLKWLKRELNAMSANIASCTEKIATLDKTSGIQQTKIKDIDGDVKDNKRDIRDVNKRVDNFKGVTT